MEGIVLAETDTLHELCAETHKWYTTKRLCDESHGRDFGAVQVTSSEQVPVVASSADLLFVPVCNDHHFNVRIQIKLNALGRCGDFADSDFGLIDAALTNQPPR
jgi:hypothetical protein